MNKTSFCTTVRSTLVGVTIAAAIVVSPSIGLAYPPQPPVPGKPSLDVRAFSPVCQSNAPYIEYSIVPQNFKSTGPATLTFRDVNGRVVEKTTVTNLSGTVIYPGAKVDSAGNATDWPGWKLTNGAWVIDTSDAILRQGLTITVEVNPTATAEVGYPASTSACAGPAVAAPPQSAGTLPRTGGSELGTTLTIAGAALAAGLGITALAGRRRRHRSSSVALPDL